MASARGAGCIVSNTGLWAHLSADLCLSSHHSAGVRRWDVMVSETLFPWQLLPGPPSTVKLLRWFSLVCRYKADPYIPTVNCLRVRTRWALPSAPQRGAWSEAEDTIGVWEDLSSDLFLVVKTCSNLDVLKCALLGHPDAGPETWRLDISLSLRRHSSVIQFIPIKIFRMTGGEKSFR